MAKLYRLTDSYLVDLRGEPNPTKATQDALTALTVKHTDEQDKDAVILSALPLPNNPQGYTIQVWKKTKV